MEEALEVSQRHCRRESGEACLGANSVRSEMCIARPRQERTSPSGATLDMPSTNTSQWSLYVAPDGAWPVGPLPFYKHSAPLGLAAQGNFVSVRPSGFSFCGVSCTGQSPLVPRSDSTCAGPSALTASAHGPGGRPARNPMSTPLSDGLRELRRSAARQLNAMSNQQPPRSTRYEPVEGP